MSIAASQSTQLLRALHSSLVQVSEKHMLVDFSVCANGGLEKCDIAAIEKNFEVIYGMCKEFKFKPPVTSKFMEMLKNMDEEHFENTLLTKGAITERQTMYRYEAQKVRISMKYSERLCKRAHWSRSMKINILKDLWREMFGGPGNAPGAGGGGGGGATDDAPTPDPPAEELPEYRSDSECSHALKSDIEEEGCEMSDIDEEGCERSDIDEEGCSIAGKRFEVAESDESDDGAIAIAESDEEGAKRPWPLTPVSTTMVDISAQRKQTERKGKKVVKKPAMAAVVTKTSKVVKPACIFRLVKKLERGKEFVQIRNSVSKKIMLQVSAKQAGDMEKALEVAEQLADKAEEGLSKEELTELRNQMFASAGRESNAD